MFSQDPSGQIPQDVVDLKNNPNIWQLENWDCTEPNCVTLKKLCAEAVQKSEKNQKKLKKKVKKVYENECLHSYEQALKLYLAGCIANSPDHELKDRFKAPALRRTDNMLTPHETMKYDMDLGYMLSGTDKNYFPYKLGMKFLSDLVSKDFVVESENESSIRTNPAISINLKRAASDDSCDKPYCQQLRTEGRGLSVILRNEIFEILEFEKKIKEMETECKALTYALRILVGINELDPNMSSEKMERKRIREERMADDELEKLRKLRVPMTDKGMAKINGYEVYKDAVKYVRALLWHEQLPSDEQGRRYLERDDESRNGIKKGELTDYWRSMSDDERMSWNAYLTEIGDRIRHFETRGRREEVLQDSAEHSKKPSDQQQLDWLRYHLRMTRYLKEMDEIKARNREIEQQHLLDEQPVQELGQMPTTNSSQHTASPSAENSTKRRSDGSGAPSSKKSSSNIRNKNNKN